MVEMSAGGEEQEVLGLSHNFRGHYFIFRNVIEGSSPIAFHGPFPGFGCSRDKESLEEARREANSRAKLLNDQLNDIKQEQGQKGAVDLISEAGYVVRFAEKGQFYLRGDWIYSSGTSSKKADIGHLQHGVNDGTDHKGEISPNS